MQRFEKVAEVLGMFPAKIWGEPASRSWSPSRQVVCIDAFKYEREHLHNLTEAISTLVANGYPLAEITTNYGPSIHIAQKVRHEPTVTSTINEWLIKKIEQYMVLNPEIEHEVGIHILCVMEATSEYLANRIDEELKFLDHITEEIGTSRTPAPNGQGMTSDHVLS